MTFGEDHLKKFIYSFWMDDLLLEDLQKNCWLTRILTSW